MTEPFYDRSGIRIYCADTMDVLPQLARTERTVFIYADPPYGIRCVKAGRNGHSTDTGIGNQKPFGSIGGNGKCDEQGRVGSIGGAKPEGLGPTRKGTIGGNGRRIPFADWEGFRPQESEMGQIGGRGTAKTTSDAGKVGGGGATRESGRPSKNIPARLYAPVIGDDSTDTAVNAYRLCAQLWPKATMVWWGANYYADQLPPSSCWIVWDKQMTGLFADGEMAWTNSRSPVRIFVHRWSGLLKASERNESRFHPNQKPVALAEWTILKYAPPDALIVEPFMGSGGALVAAKRLGRRAVGIELSEHYCRATVTRLGQEVLDFADEVVTSVGYEGAEIAEPIQPALIEMEV